MKKVGICACYDTKNYGSMLQAFATQIAVSNLGFENEFIVYKKKKNISFMLKLIPRLLILDLVKDKIRDFKKKMRLFFHPSIKRNESIRYDAFKRFQSKYYRDFSPIYYGYDELKENASNYETVLVGSDQLWTPGGLDTNFYNLMFVPDSINKVSYATSFGVSHIPAFQRKKTQKYIARINHLSVRETRGAEIIKEIAHKEAKVVADPTMLLTAEEWEKIISNEKIINEAYIFCYLLGENTGHRKIVQEFAKQKGLRIVTTPHLDSYVKIDEKFGDYQLFDVGPDGFVNLIRNAEYVITDSFHGTVFSILYQKKFLVLNRFDNGKQSRNSRIDSLCGLLGVEGRRYKGNTNSIDEKIDFGEVNQKLRALREASLHFLKDSLMNQ